MGEEQDGKKRRRGGKGHRGRGREGVGKKGNRLGVKKIDISTREEKEEQLSWKGDKETDGRRVI